MTDRESWLDHANAARASLGFLDVAQTAAMSTRGVLVLDPVSTLVSPDVLLEPGVVLFPNVTLEVRHGGSIRIGRDTRLASGTRCLAEGGRIEIGSRTEIGEEGGFSITARRDETVAIGDRCRLTGGGIVSGASAVGAGAQILGRIDARDCRLEAGGNYEDPDPDARGAVFKGSGRAQGIALQRGQVIQAFGLFSAADVRNQSFFHPKP